MHEIKSEKLCNRDTERAQVVSLTGIGQHMLSLDATIWCWCRASLACGPLAGTRLEDVYLRAGCLLELDSLGMSHPGALASAQHVLDGEKHTID